MAIVRFLKPLIVGVSLAAASSAGIAAEYEIDPAHSFVRFRIQHLGFSWLMGEFQDLEGNFTYDPADSGASAVSVTIDTASIDSNHAERDKHLRSDDFLHVEKYPEATFRSTGYSGDAEGGTLEGVLTLHGVSKPITIEMKKVGEGKDPWGGYRAGFIGTTTLTRRDFGISYDLGPTAETMELELGIEGVRR